MKDEVAKGTEIPREPDIDDNGVDLAQIRQMLDLIPAQRLTMIAQFTGSLLALRSSDEDSRSG